MAQEIDQGMYVYAFAAEHKHQLGITRRDWLAGKFAASVYSNNVLLEVIAELLQEDKNINEFEKMASMDQYIAKRSYKLADALIAESKI